MCPHAKRESHATARAILTCATCKKCVTQIIYLGPLPSARRRAGRGVSEGARERGSDAPRASRRKENFTNPKKPWKRPQACLFAATADPAGASEAERPVCARRCARDRASARVRPPALRVAARSGFHHSSHDPGNGRIDRDNRETDALIVMTEGNPEPGPEAEIAAKVLARHPKLFPTPTRSARVRNTKSRSAARFKKKCAGES